MFYELGIGGSYLLVETQEHCQKKKEKKLRIFKFMYNEHVNFLKHIPSV